MITIMFTGYSVSDEYIQNTRVDVEDVFLQYYPDVDIETLINKEEEEFEFIYKGEWSSPEDIDEDVIRDICQSNELYCHILIDNKISLEFNNELDEKIERSPSDGDPFVYHAMSGGERRRLNLAVSQAFAHIMTLSSGVCPSLVF